MATKASSRCFGGCRNESKRGNLWHDIWKLSCYDLLLLYWARNSEAGSCTGA
ncbi:uncharacterized protein K444DRAFT_612505 [Hyaloscypha bicolor E]|uniref:Uncharacterized protein n=1 Tax=Hyaloscypha bicolor E TaxID=1095630 RepID=A0A2J6TBA6_9HELO|nr:uncharacterized protein K444DRAFT_612505 [Hyaloscypha bicolor E]PMD60314.1 hypothetical protein K444DRAFT_612505 [Hyaloscypha bicolor E]